MNGAMFPNYIGIADLNPTFGLRLEGKVLWRSSNDRAMSNEVVGAHLDRSLDHHVRSDHALVSDNRLRPDNRKWTDLDLGAKLGLLVNDGGRMNFHNTPASLKLK